MSSEDDLRGLLIDMIAGTEADFAAAFRVMVAPDGEIRVVGITIEGSQPVATLCARFEGATYGRLNASVGSLPSANRWVARSRGELTSSWLGDNVWDALGIGSQIGCLLVIEGRAWGWIGALRWRTRPPYGAEDERTARPPMRQVIERVIAADRMIGTLPKRPGTFVVRGDEVLMGDAGAGPWLADQAVISAVLSQLGRATGTERHALAAGAVYSATALIGREGPAWLVRIARPQLIAATTLLGLPPMQRLVAEMAAAGATIKEIAKAIAASENTVKTHLKRVYEACGVATRAELSELVRITVPRDDA